MSNQPPVYWEAEVIFPEVKWWMRDVDHSPLSSVEVNLSLQDLVGEPEGRRPLGRPRHKWEDNVKMDFRWDGGHGLNRSGSGKRQVAGLCECGNEPSGSIKYGEFLD